MKIYQALQIGEYHTNHCEDYLYWGKIGKDKVLCAVMDGCTMATDSYFASTLVGKLLRKISLGKGYQELYTESKQSLDDYLKSILKELFSELVVIKNQLMLDKNELLTTLIILVLDQKDNCGIVLVIGDGIVSINGKITEFDQDNKPDYLGFHLSANFENWYDKQTQKIEFENIQDISISTDGIFSFSKVKQVATSATINVINHLLVDKLNSENHEMLILKLKYLEHQYGLKPTDDFGMIRVLNI